jgi:hypothetical protein
LAGGPANAADQLINPALIDFNFDGLSNNTGAIFIAPFFSFGSCANEDLIGFFRPADKYAVSFEIPARVAFYAIFCRTQSGKKLAFLQITDSPESIK